MSKSCKTHRNSKKDRKCTPVFRLYEDKIRLVKELVALQSKIIQEQDKAIAELEDGIETFGTDLTDVYSANRDKIAGNS